MVDSRLCLPCLVTREGPIRAVAPQTKKLLVRSILSGTRIGFGGVHLFDGGAVTLQSRWIVLSDDAF